MTATDPHVGRRMAECLQLQSEGQHLALCRGCQFIRDAFSKLYPDKVLSSSPRRSANAKT